MTVSQQQAIQSAESYLDMGGFSKAGLIEQLSSGAVGFPEEGCHLCRKPR